MIDEILVLDNSSNLHISNTRHVLKNLKFYRDNAQRVYESFNSPFVENCIRGAWNSRRQQVDVEEFMLRLSQSSSIHQDHSDFLKVVLLDQDIYSSRENTNFGLGVTFTYSPLNRYTIVSTARLGDEFHTRHVLAHELGHAFGAPNSRRQGVYESLGAHCPNKDCTMHQELTEEASYNQALEVAKTGRIYCSSCAEDIWRYGR
jgi:predicted Zn-dependent protease